MDKDRKKKNCEYAVLVSTLEPEDEVYKEEKMLVRVGSIEDIAYYGDIEELRNGMVVASTGK